MGEKLYEVSEFARELGVSAQTIRRDADAGKLEVIRTVSGHRLFTAATIRRERARRKAARRAAKVA